MLVFGAIIGAVYSIDKRIRQITVSQEILELNPGHKVAKNILRTNSLKPFGRTTQVTVRGIDSIKYAIEYFGRGQQGPQMVDNFSGFRLSHMSISSNHIK